MCNNLLFNAGPLLAQVQMIKSVKRTTASGGSNGIVKNGTSFAVLNLYACGRPLLGEHFTSRVRSGQDDTNPETYRKLYGVRGGKTETGFVSVLALFTC
jgi:hypothetical protein